MVGMDDVACFFSSEVLVGLDDDDDSALELVGFGSAELLGFASAELDC